METDLPTLEDGLDTVVGPRGVKLSGGQMQRTAATRMFIRESELLIFDDLSSGLDVDTEHILWERLFETTRATCPRRFSPPSRAASGRPNCRPKRRSRRGSRNAG